MTAKRASASWWVGLTTRAEFTAALAEESRRMNPAAGFQDHIGEQIREGPARKVSQTINHDEEE